MLFWRGIKFFLCLFFLSLCLLICFNEILSTEDAFIYIQSCPVSGKAQVFIRPSGTGKYKKVAHMTPIKVRVENGKNYDVMVVIYDGLFFKYIGEKKDVTSLFPVTITTNHEIIWARVILFAFVPLLGILECSRRKKIKKSLELEATLREAEARAQDAELRAERSAMETKIPVRIGKYEVLEKIGEGGTAVVYKARDSSGDIYALKVPHVRFIENEEFMRRFTHEAKIGQNLNNPHIARIYDYNVNIETGMPFICLEFLECDTLAGLKKKNNIMEVPHAMKYVTEILAALEYAHSKGVIHRDIKPANIAITRNNKVKIMDFGVAKATDLSTVTLTDTALGTPRYMAPEQIDSKFADARADLYAVGMIFYELITGRLPFEDEDPYRIVMKKLSVPPVPPTKFNPSIPEEIEQLILKLIEKDPEARYQSTSELIADLEHFVISQNLRNQKEWQFQTGKDCGDI